MQRLRTLGVRLPQAVVVDPRSHYGTDPEMVAVTAYEPHPITRSVSFTFYPGVRPLDRSSGWTVSFLLRPGW